LSLQFDELLLFFDKLFDFSELLLLSDARYNHWDVEILLYFILEEFYFIHVVVTVVYNRFHFLEYNLIAIVSFLDSFFFQFIFNFLFGLFLGCELR